jgi:hypothetical protein
MARPHGAKFAKDMPAPDKIIIYPSGEWGPAMFHYAIEGQSLRDIASDHGFDLDLVFMSDIKDESDPIYRKYFEEGCSFEEIARFPWHLPILHGRDWKISGQWDTEDGPVSCYLRKRPAQRIEAGTAEPVPVSVHESPVTEGDAP